jgi:hypothetical protein
MTGLLLYREVRSKRKSKGGNVMDYLIIAIISLASLMAILMPLFIAILKARKRKRAKAKEKLTFRGIEQGIGEQLHKAYPGSKWRWVCCPVGFAINGGIARIDVMDVLGKQLFADICFQADDNRMILQMANVASIAESPTYDSAPKPPSPAPHPKPYDEENIVTWYNIVLIDSLNTLIENLNADGEVCLYIGRDGVAYTEEDGDTTAVCDFGEMPDVALWRYITERLGKEGLFAEIQDDNRIFISWA